MKWSVCCVKTRASSLPRNQPCHGFVSCTPPTSAFTSNHQSSQIERSGPEDDWIAHSRLKRPHGDDTRECVNVLPPPRQKHNFPKPTSEVEHHTTITLSLEVNMSRLRIRPNKAISPPKVRHRPPVVARLATNVARGVCTFLTGFPSTRVATWAKTVSREGKDVRRRQSGFRSPPPLSHSLSRAHGVPPLMILGFGIGSISASRPRAAPRAALGTRQAA